jgi:hypothetical protein
MGSFHDNGGINLICFILVRHTNNITKDKTTPSSVTVEVFTTSVLNALTCFGPYGPSSEGHRYSLETTPRATNKHRTISKNLFLEKDRRHKFGPVTKGDKRKDTNLLGL